MVVVITHLAFGIQNINIDFIANEIYACGHGIDMTPSNSNSVPPIMGPQFHNGNKWFPIQHITLCPPPVPAGSLCLTTTRATKHSYLSFMYN